MFSKERYQYSEKPMDDDQIDNSSNDSIDIADENDDINDAIFLSTYTDEVHHSSEDSDPVYDDGD